MAKKHSILGGPSIHVLCKVFEERITNLDLFLLSSNELSWECKGDSSCRLIEPLIHDWLADYCQRKPAPLPLPLNLGESTPFTCLVLKNLQSIPFGVSVTYQQLAAQLEKPKAARAVGTACGRNPIPLIIPCHRVLASGSKLGGFSAGLEIKRRLLAFEKISFSPAAQI